MTEEIPTSRRHHDKTSLKPFPWLTRANADSRRLLRSALLVLAMDQPKKWICFCGGYQSLGMFVIFILPSVNELP